MIFLISPAQRRNCFEFSIKPIRKIFLLPVKASLKFNIINEVNTKRTSSKINDVYDLFENKSY